MPISKLTAATESGARAHRRTALRSLAVPLTFLLLDAAGCGSRPGTAEVSGKVLMKDGSVPQGGVRVVQFVPAADTTAEIRKSASGEIQDDGTFVAYTRKPGDGVFVGKYDVTFAVWESPMNSKSLIDPKYSRASTTPYHIAVDGDVSDLKFELEKGPTGPRAR